MSKAVVFELFPMTVKSIPWSKAAVQPLWQCKTIVKNIFEDYSLFLVHTVSQIFLDVRNLYDEPY